GQRWWEQPSTGAAAVPSRPWPQAPTGTPGSSGPSSRAASGSSSRAASGSSSRAASGPAGAPGPASAPGGPAVPASPAAAAAGYAAASGGPSGGMPAGGVNLPTPPPLSAPLSTAGTGPMPHLSQKMVPPGDTIWWTRPGAPGGSRSGPHGPVPPGSGPPG